MPAPIPVSLSARPAAKEGPGTGVRDDSLDIAKGFGIILVVIGHCLLGLINGGFFTSGAPWPDAAVYTIYAFHMPLFFVISGHLVSGKQRPAGASIRRLFPSIVYPYFLWSILQGLTQVYMSSYTNSHVPISVLYKIAWIPIVPYWFLYALFFSHLGYLAIRRFSHAIQLAIAFVLYLVLLLILRRFGMIFPIIVMETARAFVFFILGVATVTLVKRLGGGAAAASTVLFALLATIIYQLGSQGIVQALVTLGTACAGIAATLGWSRMLAPHRNAVVKTLSFLGRYSMSIYVMHIFVTAGTRILFKRLGAHDTASFLVAEILLGTALGIAVPLAVNWVVSKSSLDRWFGLQHMETA